MKAVTAETAQAVAKARKMIKWWDGKNPQFDASIVMTAYRAEATIEEAIESIFNQQVNPGTTAQLIVGVDAVLDDDNDRTFELVEEIARRAPDWLTVDCFRNEFPKIVLGGRSTGRSNFFNCYSRIRAPFVLYLNCDDIWLTKTKLQSQLDHFKKTGHASVTALDTAAPRLKTWNLVPEIVNPFERGNTLLMSSYGMPYFNMAKRKMWWIIPFLDWPIMCYCWQKFGIDRLLNETTFYRIHQGSSWSVQDKFTKHKLITIAVRQMLVFGPYSLGNRVKLWRYLKSLRP